MRRIGFIVNPIAGMGGRVGLKGTDGEDILKLAREKGAVPIAPERGIEFLKALRKLVEDIQIITVGGAMGEEEAKEAEIPYEVIYRSQGETTASDTKRGVLSIAKKKVPIIVFCGGDGTAVDVAEAINGDVPTLGVPTGVKMFSGVFALTPQSAAHVIFQFLHEELNTRSEEVLDIDEDAYRKGNLSIKLKGVLSIPNEDSYIQQNKSPSPLSDDESSNKEGIARFLDEKIGDENCILGPGTTMKSVADYWKTEKTLLGVDFYQNRKAVQLDLNESQLLAIVTTQPTKLVVTPIGGQGFVFGRGNQQLSSSVLREIKKKNIIIIATHNKLNKLSKLHVDTGDLELDQMFKGFWRVITDFHEEQILPMD
ncbi:MAG: ATP-NAD kinase family protein [Candidatus Ranarchaeia archaeon]|jgi:predicted polyphosphate/ATP-dependent NAD kinase